jgi:predicted glutamine amidotransferase
MCGHIGIVNREKSVLSSEKLLKYFYQGLYLDALRGQHGTGVCAVKGDGTNRMFKRALQASDFLELSTTKKIISDNNNVFLIGHNRHATYGEHTSDNTHPFVNGSITLFHNGTLQNHKNLTPDKKFTVDSEAISYMLSESSIITKALEKIEGAYSLVWYDDVKETLSFARNKERPLFFGSIKGSKSFVWASEAKMIEWLFERNSIELDEILELEVGKLITVHLDDTIKIEVSNFTPASPKENIYSKYYDYTPRKIESLIPGISINQEIEVKGLRWVPYGGEDSNVVYGYLNCEYKDAIHFNISGVTRQEKDNFIGKSFKIKVISTTSSVLGYGTPIPKDKTKAIAVIEKNNTISEDIKIKDRRGIQFITLGAFNRKTSYGCSNCSCDLLPAQSEEIVWDIDGSPYCVECAEFFSLT